MVPGDYIPKMNSSLFLIPENGADLVRFLEFPSLQAGQIGLAASLIGSDRGLLAFSLF
jgi:hypothetical protein